MIEGEGGVPLAVREPRQQRRHPQVGDRHELRAGPLSQLAAHVDARSRELARDRVPRRVVPVVVVERDPHHTARREIVQHCLVGVSFPDRPADVAHETRNGRRDLIGADLGTRSSRPLVEVARQSQQEHSAAREPCTDSFHRASPVSCDCRAPGAGLGLACGASLEALRHALVMRP